MGSTLDVVRHDECVVTATFVRRQGRRDRVYVTRDDGTSTGWDFPSYGDGLPHDLCHLVVEEELSLTEGFWGLVDQGVDVALVNGQPTLVHDGRPLVEQGGYDISGLIEAEAAVAVLAGPATAVGSVGELAVPRRAAAPDGVSSAEGIAGTSGAALPGSATLDAVAAIGHRLRHLTDSGAPWATGVRSPSSSADVPVDGIRGGSPNHLPPDPPARRPPHRGPAQAHQSTTQVQPRSLVTVASGDSLVEDWQNDCMAIIGAHVLLYTPEPEAVRAIFRDVFGWKHVDDGDGWLIFALPSAELGVHPAEGPTFESGIRHQVTFMCDDIGATVEDLRHKGVEVRGEPEDEGFGITTMLVLPGGVEVMLYEPRHQTAI